MDELKLCPFCGGNDCLIGRCDFDSGVVFIECGHCGVYVEPKDCYDNEAKAVELWNRRAERTCKVDGVYDYGERDELRAYALSCGHEFDWNDEEPPAYCPDCGAKVVKG